MYESKDVNTLVTFISAMLNKTQYYYEGKYELRFDYYNNILGILVTEMYGSPTQKVYIEVSHESIIRNTLSLGDLADTYVNKFIMKFEEHTMSKVELQVTKSKNPFDATYITTIEAYVDNKRISKESGRYSGDAYARVRKECEQQGYKAPEFNP